jgi:hypothetical protein
MTLSLEDLKITASVIFLSLLPNGILRPLQVVHWSP